MTAISLPYTCACGHAFTIDHALNCHMGGFPTICHNKGSWPHCNLLTEVCHDVCVEPPLQPLSGETLSFSTANRDDSARLSTGVLSLPQQQAFDVRVYNSNSPAYHGLELSVCYRWHEREKQWAYEQRVRGWAWLLHSLLFSVLLEEWGTLQQPLTNALLRWLQLSRNYPIVLWWGGWDVVLPFHSSSQPSCASEALDHPSAMCHVVNQTLSI